MNSRMKKHNYCIINVCEYALEKNFTPHRKQQTDKEKNREKI